MLGLNEFYVETQGRNVTEQKHFIALNNIHSETLSKHRHPEIPCVTQSPLFQRKNKTPVC